MMKHKAGRKVSTARVWASMCSRGWYWTADIKMAFKNGVERAYLLKWDHPSCRAAQRAGKEYLESTRPGIEVDIVANSCEDDLGEGE